MAAEFRTLSHTQMDGAHAAKFLDRLQQEINKLLV